MMYPTNRRLLVVLTVLSSLAVGSAPAGTMTDCNDNGLDDTEETATGFTEIVVQSGVVYACQLADIDTDGDLDLLGGGVAGVASSPVTWRENVDGAGAFGPVQSIGPADEDGDPVPADLDGDGDLDILVPYYGQVNGRIVWFRNDGNDCDGDRVPDVCQSDCNGNGIADTCDIRGRFSIDCDGNGIPDECDAPCGAPCDQDGDGCRDAVDAAPGDATACGDTDSDGCDDCSNGVYDPSGDGANSDTDGVCDLTDCDPSNNEVWGAPGESSGLTLTRQDSATGLSWNSPANAGGIHLRYDLLRSSSASDFLSEATTQCVESDDGDESAIDTDVPATTELFHYLVRVENDCPGGTGSMGADSDGAPREGRSCPPPVPLARLPRDR